MNWYKKAQIWNVDYNTTFDSMIVAIYELEYKYNAVRQRPFNGLEQRKQNILNNLEKKLTNLISETKSILIRLFQHWLKDHALNNPEQWAIQRTHQQRERFYDDEESYLASFRNLMREIFIHTNENSLYYDSNNLDIIAEKEFQSILNKVKQNIEQFPAIASYLEYYLTDYREWLYQSLSDDGIDEFNNIHGQEFKTKEQAENYIENLTINDFDVFGFFDSIENFVNGITTSTNNNYLDIYKEISQHFAFPAWFKVWEPKGIVKTRETIIRILQEIEASSDIPSSLSAINLGINAVHQGGYMLEYLEEIGVEIDEYDTKKLLTNLSNNDVTQWNEELREIGVQI